jgi:hypothetical protein
MVSPQKYLSSYLRSAVEPDFFYSINLRNIGEIAALLFKVNDLGSDFGG